MRLTLVTAIAVLAGCCYTSWPADLRNEDLRSVQEAFRRKDPSLEWFEALTLKPVNASTSLMVAQAEPLAPQPAGANRAPRLAPVFAKCELGVFLVSGPSNHVEKVLDISPQCNPNGFPKIAAAGPNSAVLHFHSDYGIYAGSIKYFYSLAGGVAVSTPPVKIPFGKLELKSSAVQNGNLSYTAWALKNVSQIAIDPRSDGAPPAFRITRDPVPGIEETPQHEPVHLPDGRLATIENTPLGRPHQAAGIAIVDASGEREFYPVPVTTMQLFPKLRPDEQIAIGIEDDIGPFARDGSTIWFANSFYDGEGFSGVGAIGSFDLQTNKFEMRYLPQIAPWSGSAIKLDGDDIWIGLMRQPEGAAFSGGLLRYNTRTESVTKFDIPDYIYTIDRIGDTVYCGSADGLYELREGKVAHLRFEPDRNGKLTMIP